MQKEKTSLGWWRVTTGAGMSEDPDCVALGTHYGHLDEIALRLADKAATFYSDHGVLNFYRVEKPELPDLAKVKKDHVRVRVDEFRYNNERKKLIRLLEGRPVEIDAEECLIRRKS